MLIRVDLDHAMMGKRRLTADDEGRGRKELYEPRTVLGWPSGQVVVEGYVVVAVVAFCRCRPLLVEDARIGGQGGEGKKKEKREGGGALPE